MGGARCFSTCLWVVVGGEGGERRELNVSCACFFSSCEQDNDEPCNGRLPTCFAGVSRSYVRGTTGSIWTVPSRRPLVPPSLGTGRPSRRSSMVPTTCAVNGGGGVGQHTTLHLDTHPAKGAHPYVRSLKHHGVLCSVEQHLIIARILRHSTLDLVALVILLIAPCLLVHYARPPRPTTPRGPISAPPHSGHLQRGRNTPCARTNTPGRKGEKKQPRSFIPPKNVPRIFAAQPAVRTGGARRAARALSPPPSPRPSALRDTMKSNSVAPTTSSITQPKTYRKSYSSI